MVVEGWSARSATAWDRDRRLQEPRFRAFVSERLCVSVASTMAVVKGAAGEDATALVAWIFRSFA